MVIETIIIGIIANVATQLFGRGYQKLLEGVQKDFELPQILHSNLDSLKLDEQETMNVESFLGSQEVENVISQIFSLELLIKEKEKNIGSVKKEFLELLTLHVDIPKNRCDQISDVLFDILLESCAILYERIMGRGAIYSHDRLSNLRSQFIVARLDVIGKNLEFLKTQEKSSIQQYLEFEKEYREQIVDRYKYIRPPHFENAEKIPIDDLYVSPNFANIEYKGEKHDIIKAEELLLNIDRSVILGDPGAGKTTFTQKICYDFARGLGKTKYSMRDVTPILIILRDYGSKLESESCSIIQFIENISASWHQKAPPTGIFDYLLLNGRALIIFDGLDELLDTSKRQIISDNIESFCNQYPTVPVLVTSRKVGYEQAPLSKDKFSTYYISDFDEDQVIEYANKWFTKNLEISPEEKQGMISSFLIDSLNVKDLRSNPLMLSLMCDLYRGEGYIPKNRPDVFEKCSELLFKKWDKIRGVSEGVVLDAHLKPSLGYIAFQIYSNEKMLGGITERKLKDLTVQYLYPKHIDDEDIAISQADRFISFCKGRAWVFSEIGSPGGENLYQFTHRTFLEYFTAYHLVRNYRTPQDLFQYLLPKIIKREWDVVAQLALQLQNWNIEDAGNEIITDILKEARGKDYRIRFNLMSFSERSLEFVVISPSVINEIVSDCLDLCIDIHLKSKEDRSLQKEDITLDEIINPLLIADRENIGPIRKSILGNISEKILIQEDRSASSALKILSSLPAFDFYFTYKGKDHLSSKMNLENIQYEIVQTCHDRICELCIKNWYNAVDGVILQTLSYQDVIEAHGPGILFSISAVYGTYPLLVKTIADDITRSFTGIIIENEENRRLILTKIGDLADILLRDPLPWPYSTSPVYYSLLSHFFEEFMIHIQGEELSTKDIFSLFTFIAPIIEHEMTLEKPNYTNIDVFEKIQSIESEALDPLLFIFRAKLRGLSQFEVDDLIQTTGFNPEQKEIIIKWINNQLKFIQLDESLKIDKVHLYDYEVIPY